MWKKDERQDEPVSQRPAPASVPMAPPAPAPPGPVAASPSPAPPRSPSAPAAGRAEHAVIGRSITIRGDVTGDEDLVIQGRVEGSVDLKQHSVTVGHDGEVVASIVGRVVTIEGRVEGNVSGGEQVTLRTSATVKGDIRSPRVVLENGARFRGLVDMGEAEEEATVRSDARKPDGSARSKPESGGAGNGLAAEPGKSASSWSPPEAATADSAKGSATSASGKARRPSEVEA